MKNDILAEFKSMQNLMSSSVDLSKPKKKKPVTQKEVKVESRKVLNKPNDPYVIYRTRLENGMFDKFTTKDMLYFFIDVAKENGVNYIVSNYAKELRQFKLCVERGYSVEDILAMIEFLFTSGQPYLDVNRLHPGILLTNWAKTIYADTKLWLDDKYEPYKKQSYASQSKPHQKREFTGDTSKETVKIDDWGI